MSASVSFYRLPVNHVQSFHDFMRWTRKVWNGEVAMFAEQPASQTAAKVKTKDSDENFHSSISFLLMWWMCRVYACDVSRNSHYYLNLQSPSSFSPFRCLLAGRQADGIKRRKQNNKMKLPGKELLRKTLCAFFTLLTYSRLKCFLINLKLDSWKKVTLYLVTGHS